MDWFSKDGFTAIAAGVAAFTGAWGWLKGLRGDRILVRYGAYADDVDDSDSLKVQNLSSQQGYLEDVGFVYEDGRLCSLIELASLYGESSAFSVGETTLASRSLCRGWVKQFSKKIASKKIVGAYAHTTTQTFYRMDFSQHEPFCFRLKLRLKLYVRNFFHMF